MHAILQEFARDDGFYEVATTLGTKSKELQAADRKAEEAVELKIKEAETAGALLQKDDDMPQPQPQTLPAGGSTSNSGAPPYMTLLEAAVVGETPLAAAIEGEPVPLSPALSKIAAELAAVLVKVQALATEEERTLVVATAVFSAVISDAD